jgi:hypothetical protein
VTIINIYAPTNEKELEEKQYFYDQQQATVEAVPKKRPVDSYGGCKCKNR